MRKENVAIMLIITACIAIFIASWFYVVWFVYMVTNGDKPSIFQCIILVSCFYVVIKGELKFGDDK